MLPFLDPHAWRTAVFGLCAFPAFLAATTLRLAGRRTAAIATASWIGDRWLGADPGRLLVSSPARGGTALAVSFPASAITLYLIVGILINLAYPLRPDSGPADWGGPSLAGRWIVHAAGGVLFAVVTPLIGGGLQALARRVLLRPAPIAGTRSTD